MRLARMFAVCCAVSALFAACGRNPRYCDNETPCGYAGWVCDLQGVCPASDDLTNSCIPPDQVCWDAGVADAQVADAAPPDAALDDASTCEVMQLGYLDTPGSAWGVKVSGNRAYVADGGGLRIIDVSNHAAPTELGYFSTGTGANSVFVVDTIAYVTDNVTGLRIVDVSDPTSPSEVGFFDPVGGGQDVAVSGTVAYYAGAAGLYTVDVSNPAVPIQLDNVSTGQGATDVHVVGTVVYWTSRGSGGMQIVNASVPSNLSVLGTFATTNIDAWGVYVDSNRAYVADDALGLHIVDISNQASPSLITTIDTPGAAQDVEGADGLIYVPDGNTSVRIIDPIDFAHNSLPTTGFAQDIAIDADIAFVAEAGAGLRIYQLCP